MKGGWAGKAELLALKAALCSAEIDREAQLPIEEPGRALAGLCSSALLAWPAAACMLGAALHQPLAYIDHCRVPGQRQDSQKQPLRTYMPH